MLGFINSPVDMMVILVVLLLLFGPQKLPEIGQQLGRALREIKRSTSELTNSFNMDDRDTYDPPRYDNSNNYNSGYDSYNYPRSEEANGSSLPQEDVWPPQLPEAPAASAPEPPRGDFAAAALAGTETEFGTTPSSGASGPAETPTYGVMASPNQTESISAPGGTVPRKG